MCKVREGVSERQAVWPRDQPVEGRRDERCETRLRTQRSICGAVAKATRFCRRLSLQPHEAWALGGFAQAVTGAGVYKQWIAGALDRTKGGLAQA